MQIKSFIVLLLTGIFLLGSACKKKESEPLKFYTEYFGLQAGRFVEYDATSIRHDAALNVHDTTNFQLRTVIGEEVTDNEGRVARKFLRYTRTDAAQPWTLHDVWTAILTGNMAELVEENQRTIKLVFIPTELKEWDPNAYNMLGSMTSYYTNLHAAAQINSLQFDSTLVVEQENYKTLIDYRRKNEMYAPGIGMISKYYKNLKIVNFDTLSPTKGDELFFKITNYGLE